MRAATSAWDRPSSRRSEVSCPDTECRRSAISRKPGNTVGWRRSLTTTIISYLI